MSQKKKPQTFIDSSKIFSNLQKDPDNNVCFECNKENPQWSSVHFGIYLCLDCSGRHRHIGVHLSFVQSINMDSWSDEHILEMSVGGNRACREFFHKYGIDSIQDLEVRYSHFVAKLYLDKIQTLILGLEWTDPPVEEIKQKFQKKGTQQYFLRDQKIENIRNVPKKVKKK